MAIQEWDGVIAKLKISGSVYPELFNDLHSVPQRERGERLRLLAYIGLQMVKMGALPVGAVGRNGKTFKTTSEEYQRYVRFWCAPWPIRMAFLWLFYVLQWLRTKTGRKTQVKVDV